MAPLSTRRARAKLGLEAAARAGAVFHFWFHPENLAESTAGFEVSKPSSKKSSAPSDPAISRF
jgi:hypothetical protein